VFNIWVAQQFDGMDHWSGQITAGHIHDEHDIVAKLLGRFAVKSPPWPLISRGTPDTNRHGHWKRLIILQINRRHRPAAAGKKDGEDRC
jgi:hypothetical protein